MTGLQHLLTCAGPVISVQRGLTFDLVSCRSCHSSVKRAKP